MSRLSAHRRTGGRSWTATVVATAALASLAASVPAVGLAATAGASDVRVIVDHASLTGAQVTTAPRSTSFSVVLRPQHATQLAALVASISDPHSSNYRHFLSRGAYAAQFGPSSSTVASMRSYFAHYGLRTQSGGDGSLVWRVSGLTTHVAAAFAAQVVGVRDSSGAILSELRGNGTLPSSLAQHVSGIVGLSSSRLFHSLAVTHASAHDTAGTNEQTCADAASTATAQGAYLPSQQASLYGLDSQWAKGIDGVGATIGVYELSGYSASDVSTYLNCYNVPNHVQPNVMVDGGPALGDTTVNTESEADLDIEEAAVLAPGANIVVYEAPNSASGSLDGFARMASDDTASVITTSWGECEAQLGSSGMSAENTVFQQMAAQGQTVAAAAGDDGSTDCTTASGSPINQLAVDDPASQPMVIGVGGLAVTSISPLTQAVWNSRFPSPGVNDGGSAGSQGGGAGGISSYWTRPSWQSAVGIASTQVSRLVPDVSVMADPAYGFLEYTPAGHRTNVWTAVGGTSIGSPIVAALLAVTSQACGGGRLGLITPTLYAMAAANTGFNDVTVGGNNIFRSAGSYHAGTGYDMASGLGSPDAGSFISSLCARVPASATLNSSTSGAIDSAPATVTVTLNNGAASPMANAPAPLMTATETHGTPVVVAATTTTNASGQLTYNVTSNTPGLVHLTLSSGGVTLLSTSVTLTTNVTASSVAGTISALGALSGTLRAAAQGSDTVIAGVTSSGKVVVATTASPTVVTLGVKTATGAPALTCTASTCDVAVDVSGGIVLVSDVLGATPKVITLSTTTPLASGITANSLSLTVAPTGGINVFALRSGHVVAVIMKSPSGKPTGTDLSAARGLAAATGGTASALSASGTPEVAVTIAGHVWLLNTLSSSADRDLVSASGLSTSANGTTLTSPQIVTDNGVLDVAVITSKNSLVLFTTTASSATSPVTSAVLTTSVSAVTFTPGANGFDLLARTTGGSLRLLARTPSWTVLSVNTLTGVSFGGVTLVPGGTSGLVLNVNGPTLIRA